MSILNGKTENTTLFSLAQDNKNTADISVQDPFFSTNQVINKESWNKSYPYRLVVYKRSDDGSYALAKHSDLSDSQSSGNAPAQFTLPIPPENLSVSTPFAINTSVTLGGIVEEHNGIPIRMIQFSGTTGVFPLRDSPGVGGNGAFGGILGVGSAIQNLGKKPLILTAQEQTSGDGVEMSGYFQFRLLQRFLESYALAKKTGKGRSLILAFQMIKDQAVYLVTPITFDLTRNAGSPWEYNYSIALKAWKRIDIDNLGMNVTSPFENPGSIMDILNKGLAMVRSARKVLNALSSTIRSVPGDMEHSIFEPARQAALFCKDGLGVGLAFSDLPTSIARSARNSVIEFATTKQSANNFSSKFDKDGQEAFRFFKDLQKIAIANGFIDGGFSSNNGRQTTSPRPKSNELASETITSGASGSSTASEYFATGNGMPQGALDAISPGLLNVPPEIIKAIGQERNNIRLLRRADFERFRDGAIKFADDFADSVGLNDTVYDEVYNRTSKKQNRIATDDDFDILFALNELATAFDILSTSGRVDRFKIDSIQYIAGLARRSGIAFTEPASKFLIPFQYGATLENLATKYLGNPDRWIEIAALNGLKEPYIDEEGFSIPLTTNGNGNTFFLANARNLYVNQPVSLESLTKNKTYRILKRIDKFTETQYMITVDGENDLGDYIVTDKATLHAFLPDTVNSQMSIYIPSSVGIDEADFELKAIPGVDELDPLFRVGGADLLIDKHGDLVVTENGDLKLAVGLNNIIQKAQIRVNIKKGTLNGHPGVGLPAEIGASVADINAQDILESMQGLFSDDPAFESVSAVSIQLSGPALSLDARLNIAGVSQQVPISVLIR